MSSCGSGRKGTAPKERFASERQARRRAKNNRKWRKGHHLPVPYFCPDCHGYHLTTPDEW